MTELIKLSKLLLTFFDSIKLRLSHCAHDEVAGSVESKAKELLVRRKATVEEVHYTHRDRQRQSQSHVLHFSCHNESDRK